MQKKSKIFLTSATISIALIPTLTASTVQAASQTSNNTIKLSSYSLTENAITNAISLNKAIEDASKTNATIIVPNKIIKVQPRGWFYLPKGVSLKGTGASSGFEILSPNSTTYTELFKMKEGNNNLENLVLKRDSNVYGRMLDIENGSSYFFKNIRIDGGRKNSPTDFAAIALSPQKDYSISNFHLENSSISNTTYGIVEDSKYSGTVENVFILDNSFFKNSATDVELNAPIGVGRNIEVSRNSFSSNESTSEMAGFGVGIANYSKVKVNKNSFNSYPMNALHIEDRSSEIEVSENSFVKTSYKNTGYAADVIILSGSHEISFHKNFFDATQQENSKSLLLVTRGSTTASSPYGITVYGDNSAKLSSSTSIVSDSENSVVFK